ncbi:MAG: hypothetical protein EOO41_05410, partial [Methanobacteriota archaeon]
MGTTGAVAGVGRAPDTESHGRRAVATPTTSGVRSTSMPRTYSSTLSSAAKTRSNAASTPILTSRPAAGSFSSAHTVVSTASGTTRSAVAVRPPSASRSRAPIVIKPAALRQQTPRTASAPVFFPAADPSTGDSSTASPSDMHIQPAALSAAVRLDAPASPATLSDAAADVANVDAATPMHNARVSHVASPVAVALTPASPRASPLASPTPGRAALVRAGGLHVVKRGVPTGTPIIIRSRDAGLTLTRDSHATMSSIAAAAATESGRTQSPVATDKVPTLDADAGRAEDCVGAAMPPDAFTRSRNVDHDVAAFGDLYAAINAQDAAIAQTTATLLNSAAAASSVVSPS